MKTRKLFLIVAGFMLFALTVKAQPGPESVPHRFAFAHLRTPSPSGSDCPIFYRVQGQYYTSPNDNIGLPLESHCSGVVFSGDSNVHSGTINGVSQDAYVEFRIGFGNRWHRLTRQQIESGFTYSLGPYADGHYYVHEMTVKTGHYKDANEELWVVEITSLEVYW